MLRSIDWEAWLLFMSHKGSILVEVIDTADQYHVFEVEKNHFRESPTKETLIRHILNALPSTKPRSSHTRNAPPTLVVNQDELERAL